MSPSTTADASVRTADSGSEDGECDRPVRRATRVMRLLKLAVTTLAAIVGVAKTLGLL
ncbi:hypothetical protein [Halosimplex sp. J119]